MDEPGSELLRRAISRRNLLRTAGLVGAGLTLSSPLLAACARGSSGGGVAGNASTHVAAASVTIIDRVIDHAGGGPRRFTARTSELRLAFLRVV
jgi:hypothetical protein